jgi:hypothetical protein
MAQPSNSDTSIATGPRAVTSREATPLEVTVPFQYAELSPVSPARIKGLRRNLVDAMRDARTAQPSRTQEKPPPAEPTGFIARVLQTGCALCRGHCCKGGGTHAYIDDRTMTRVRRDNPEADAWAILRLYTASVPRFAHAGSCIFHGEAGCSLPRALRAELCNSYYCDGLQRFLEAENPARPVRITASRGGLTGGVVDLSEGNPS